MSAPNIRLADQLKGEATSYARAIGVSLNALVAVAVRDYLDARKATPPGSPASVQTALAAATASAPVAHGPGIGEKPTVDATWRLAAGKVGRNEPCPCGSGKKAKQCHGGAR
jgi:preprotein translocase subunit SecA